jgi:hypothetical protein
VSRLRPALLHRTRRGWLGAVPARRAPQRSWLKPIVTGRRLQDFAPIGATLAFGRPRTSVRSRTYALARVTQLVQNVARPLLRSAGAVYLSVAMSREGTRRGPPRHRKARRDVRRGAPVERAHTRVLVERARVERHVRTETASALGVPGLPGPGGPQGAPGAALTLVRSVATPAPVPLPEPPDLPSVARDLPDVPSPSPSPFGSGTPDVDALATQVLDRIERRAIAQRERMGRI